MKNYTEVKSLIQQYPTIFHEDRQKYENLTRCLPEKITLIFANPRSGSTLLMRLLNHACLSHCIGDRKLGFFRALLEFHRTALGSHALYSRSLIDETQFADEYSGYRSERHARREIASIFRQALFCSQFGNGMCKTTILGWGNELLQPFVEVCRDLFESHDLTIVWLKRDPLNIATSMVTREGSPIYKNMDMVPQTMEIAKAQQEAFKQAAELDDVFITFGELVNNPIETLKKCNPIYQPDPKVVKSVMSRKIR